MFPDKQNPYNQAPQQAPNGQYEVVPPLPVGQNAGHSGHNPYEFIVNPNKPHKSGGLFGGNDFLKRIAVIVGGTVVLMVIVGIVVSALAPKKDTSASLSGIAETQQEIVRIATEGANQTINQSAKNFTANVELSVSTNQGQLINYLAKHGTKLGPKQLKLKQNAQTDSLLANATATNTFDVVVTTTLTHELSDYAGTLRTAYKQTSNTTVKQLLQQSYTATTTLLEQAKTVQTNNS